MEQNSISAIFYIPCLLILAALILFQLLLSAGMPLGKFAWGGKYRVLPVSLRVPSFFSAIALIVAGFAVLEKFGIMEIYGSSVFIDIIIWFFTVIFGLSIIGNLTSKSKPEKIIMTPVAIFLFLFYLFIAVG